MSPFASEPRYAVARSPMVIPSGRKPAGSPIRSGKDLAWAALASGTVSARLSSASESSRNQDRNMDIVPEIEFGNRRMSPKHNGGQGVRVHAPGVSPFRAGSPGAATRFQVVGDHVFSKPADIGGEDPTASASGERIDEARQARVIAEHEGVDGAPRRVSSSTSAMVTRSVSVVGGQ